MKNSSLYTKYRPSKFSEVVGQTHISTVLCNQIKSKKISHAYLFSGTRGTGKTTCARIFSRAVNCLNNVDGNPCNQCERCAESDSILSVYELDAASNNSVDQIRSLMEELRYMNFTDGYKIYILDEVHMLSISAFNALLKTLEEPPKNVIFILSTTELKKIPQTIISRCQKFEFRNICEEDIFENLNRIVESEGINIDDGSLRLVCELADGSMRDAISILERVALSREEITLDYTREVLGIISNEIVFDLIREISCKNLESCISLIARVFDYSVNIEIFIDNLRNILRDMMFLKINKEDLGVLFEKNNLNIRQLIDLSSMFSLDEIIALLKEFNLISEKKGLDQIEYRIYLEMLLIRVCKSRTIRESIQNKEETKVIQSQAKEEIIKADNTCDYGALSVENWGEFLNYLKQNKHMVLYSLLTNGKIEGINNNKFMFKSNSLGILKRLNKDDMIKEIKNNLLYFFKDVGVVGFELVSITEDSNYTINDKLKNYFGDVEIQNK